MASTEPPCAVLEAFSLKKTEVRLARPNERVKPDAPGDPCAAPRADPPLSVSRLASSMSDALAALPNSFAAREAWPPFGGTMGSRTPERRPREPPSRHCAASQGRCVEPEDSDRSAQLRSPGRRYSSHRPTHRRQTPQRLDSPAYSSRYCLPTKIADRLRCGSQPGRHGTTARVI